MGKDLVQFISILLQKGLSYLVKPKSHVSSLIVTSQYLLHVILRNRYYCHLVCCIFRFEGNQVELEKLNNRMWLVRHLERMRAFILDDMITVKVCCYTFRIVVTLINSCHQNAIIPIGMKYNIIFNAFSLHTFDR